MYGAILGDAIKQKIFLLTSERYISIIRIE